VGSPDPGLRFLQITVAASPSLACGILLSDGSLTCWVRASVPECTATQLVAPPAFAAGVDGPFLQVQLAANGLANKPWLCALRASDRIVHWSVAVLLSTVRPSPPNIRACSTDFTKIAPGGPFEDFSVGKNTVCGRNRQAGGCFRVA
jgi:hypothetical protein